MKKIIIIIVAVLFIFYLISPDGASSSSTMENQQSKMEDAVSKPEPTKKEAASVNFSNDPTANEVIARYNKKNPNAKITTSMVSLPPNSGFYKTVISLKYCDFIISESDGSPSFRCQSSMEINDENISGFFNEVARVMEAVENISSSDCTKITNTFSKLLRDGENSVHASEKLPSGRSVSCDISDDKYDVHWFAGSLY